MVIRYCNFYNNNSSILAQHAIKKTFGHNVRLEHKPNGKPYLVGSDNFVSISHSGTYFAIAFSNRPLGIDIERKLERSFDKIAKKLKFPNTPYDIESFYKEWTAYEARYKLGDLGFKDVRYITVFEECVFCVVGEDTNYIIEKF